MTIRAAAQRLGDPKLTALGFVEEHYCRLLEERRLVDPQLVSESRWQPGLSRFIVAGVTDLNQRSVGALERFPGIVEVWLPAPPETMPRLDAESAFDNWGRIRSEVWSRVRIDVDDQRLQSTSRAETTIRSASSSITTTLSEILPGRVAEV